MMKVKWQDFANRRKLAIADFAHMSYNDYVMWCNIRKVEPVVQSLFPVIKEVVPDPVIIAPAIPEVQVEVQQVLAIEEAVETEPAATLVSQEFSFKGLSKMRKSLVQGICDDNAIDYSAASTKRQLVQKILELNNKD